MKKKIFKKLADVDRFEMFTLTEKSKMSYYRSIYDVDLPHVMLVKCSSKQNTYKVLPFDLIVYVDIEL